MFFSFPLLCKGLTQFTATQTRMVQDFQEALENDNHDLENLSFDYSAYQSVFIKQYFASGYMYDKLKPDNIFEADLVLRFMSKENSDKLNMYLSQWKNKKKDFNKKFTSDELGKVSQLLLSIDEHISQLSKELKKK